MPKSQPPSRPPATATSLKSRTPKKARAARRRPSCLLASRERQRPEEPAETASFLRSLTLPARQKLAPCSMSIRNPLGILLVQLGTPDAPTAAALRPYLRQFLGDPRVIEAPRWKWRIILNL